MKFCPMTKSGAHTTEGTSLSSRWEGTHSSRGASTNRVAIHSPSGSEYLGFGCVSGAALVRGLDSLGFWYSPGCGWFWREAADCQVQVCWVSGVGVLLLLWGRHCAARGSAPVSLIHPLCWEMHGTKLHVDLWLQK